jgi:hypothetical protein
LNVLCINYMENHKIHTSTTDVLGFIVFIPVPYLIIYVYIYKQ